jgi:putative glutamine amidotransferase
MYAGANMLAADIKAGTQHLPDVYTDAVRDAGGLPVLLPAGTTMSEAGDSVALIDGLLLPGGPDIDPSVYGQTMRPETGIPDPDRDRWESYIFAHAMVAEIPILGVCRGMELINVALGGDLQQHLEHAELHGGPGYITHEVMIDPDSLLGEIMPYENDPVEVTTRHHQGIGRVADGLRVSAVAADGTVEAVEHMNDDLWVLGVQWHPERDKDQSVFQSLVGQAAIPKERRNG